MIMRCAHVRGADELVPPPLTPSYQGGTVRGAINLPAQTLYPTIPALYQLFKNAGIRHVIWYCGSSAGRGTRTAAWFNDHIQEQGDEQMQSVILAGGIKGWATAGGDFVKFMDVNMEYIDAQLLDHPSTVESFLEYPAEYPPQDGYLPEGSVRDYYPPYEDFASPTPSPYPVAPLMQPAFNFNSFDLHTPNVGPVASNCVEIFPPTPEPWLIPYPIFAAPPFPASYPVQTSAPKPL
ncbi:hypothetical protein CIB48_g7279 [Xylaria polymorpha]|nr:hypothetical protein CIB48_g7279 [Xylaria polymorpha]